MKVPAWMLSAAAFSCGALWAAESTELPPFHALCVRDAEACAQYDQLKSELDAQGATPPTPEQESAYYSQLVSIARRVDVQAYDNIFDPATAANVRAGMKDVRDKLAAMTLGSASGTAAQLSGEILAEEEACDAAIAEAGSHDRAATEEQLTQLNDRASATWEKVKKFTLSVDYASSYVDKNQLTDAGRLRNTKINALEERVADLRDRLKHLQQAAQQAKPGSMSHDALPVEVAPLRVDAASVSGRLAAKGLLKDIFDHKQASDVSGTVPGGAPSATGASAGVAQPYSLTVSPKTLLDVNSPPLVRQPAAERPGKLFAGKRGEDSDPGATTRAQMLKLLHLTKTVGDPVARARYTFQQTGGTCGVASQAELFAEANGIEPTQRNMKALEDTFFERARMTKQFSRNSADPGQRGDKPFGFGAGGTPDEDLGNMLDTPVRKQYLATDQQLVQAVKEGRMVQVAVNAGLLWNDRHFIKGGHAIVVTGAEVNRLTGSVLGFYINDTGDNEGARFVSAPQFLSAWHARNSIFVEPL